MSRPPRQFDVPEDEQKYVRLDKPICRFCKVLMHRVGHYQFKRVVYWQCPQCPEKAQTRSHII